MKKVRLSGAEAIARAMRESGVEYFFYVMGGVMIYSQIEEAGVKTVLCRNEKSATNMADGYARVTKKPTVCYSQHGAAAAILASMLYEPMYAHSPVVALTGSYPTLKKDSFSYQECYEMKYFEPTCKFSADVTDVGRLPEDGRAGGQGAGGGVAEAARLLAEAERPVIVCGGGVHLSGAYGELLALAEALMIPVVANPNGKG